MNKATIKYDGFAVGDKAWFSGRYDGQLEQVEVTGVDVERTSDGNLKAVWYDIKCEDEGETSCDPSELYATVDEAAENANKELCIKLRDARKHLGECLTNQAKLKDQVLKLTGKEIQDVEVPDDEES